MFFLGFLPTFSRFLNSVIDYAYCSIMRKHTPSK